MTVVGLISPGQMGASVGAAAAQSGAQVIWAGEDRSPASHKRATKAGLTDCRTIEKLVADSEIILSVSPPHEAEQIAHRVIALGFKGIYLEGNAIAPNKVQTLAAAFDGISGGQNQLVDGGIVGGPAWQHEAGTTLYLSGSNAAHIVDLFTGSPLHTNVISDKIGAASAMKMVFAAYTKGTTALLTAILGVADAHGVRDVLEAQWGDEFTRQTHQRVTANSAKAWRFAGEMREIATTFGDAGFPEGFHAGAAEVFEKLTGFKDKPSPDIDTLLASLFADCARQ